eukprot:c17582_g1_i1.p1 GENE.c17582_g1_i1~~c17582_g1_i1.p1  ORF type:complete len:356 (+),score=77.14 c17582_g1_i1:42-1109(+)
MVVGRALLLGLRHSTKLGRFANIRHAATGVVIQAAGAPSSALKYVQFEPSAPSLGEVAVEMVAAPVTAADFETFSVGPKLSGKSHSFAGTQGVGRISSVGSGITGLAQGDLVVVKQGGIGTWRTHLTCKGSDLLKIPSDIPVEYAANMFPHLLVAQALIDSIIPLKSGDVVVQNVANTLIGQLVIQVCASRDIQTINIISPRPRDDEVQERLKAIGANVVVTSDYVQTEGMGRVMLGSRVPALGIDGAGGSDADNVARLLNPGSSFVSYANLSRHPIAIPEEAKKQLKLSQFDFSKYWAALSAQQQKAAWEKSCALVQAGQANMLIERHPFGSDFLESVEYSRERFLGRRVVFTM